MEGGKHQLPRLCRRHSDVDGLIIPHLPQEDDIGGLTKGGAQGPHIAHRIPRHLALGDDAILVPVQIFDGVFDGDDMGVAGAVELIDHAGEGGGFTAASRAGDEHQAFCSLVEIDDRPGDCLLYTSRCV